MYAKFLWNVRTNQNTSYWCCQRCQWLTCPSPSCCRNGHGESSSSSQTYPLTMLMYPLSVHTCPYGLSSDYQNSRYLSLKCLRCRSVPVVIFIFAANIVINPLPCKQNAITSLVKERKSMILLYGENLIVVQPSLLGKQLKKIIMKQMELCLVEE